MSLDKLSEALHRRVEAVLVAVGARPDGSLWVLGNRLQSQRVDPVGRPITPSKLAGSGRIPAGRLTLKAARSAPPMAKALNLVRQAMSPDPSRRAAGTAESTDRPAVAKAAGPQRPASPPTSIMF